MFNRISLCSLNLQILEKVIWNALSISDNGTEKKSSIYVQKCDLLVHCTCITLVTKSRQSYNIQKQSKQKHLILYTLAYVQCQHILIYKYIYSQYIAYIYKMQFFLFLFFKKRPSHLNLSLLQHHWCFNNLKLLDSFVCFPRSCVHHLLALDL